MISHTELAAAVCQLGGAECSDEQKMNGYTDKINGDGSKACVLCVDSPDRPYTDQGTRAEHFAV